MSREVRPTPFVVLIPLLTIGRACGFKNLSWIFHSYAMSVAAKRLFLGNNSVLPDGVFIARLSKVTVNPLSLESTSTVFQKRFKVVSAPFHRS